MKGRCIIARNNLTYRVVNVGATHKLLRFGVFELNLDVEELRKDGILIKLPPQPVKVLALLASRAGQMVTRDEIQKEIWGEETYVDFEHGLNQCIKQIRTALNDSADKPLYVETLPRRGYRFLAPVVSKTVATPAPRVTESGSGIQSRINLPPVAAEALELAADATAASSTQNEDVQSAGALTERAGDVVAPARVSPVIESPSAGVAAAPGTAHAPHRQKLVRRIAWTAVGLVALFVSAVYWRTQRASALTDKDTIILADFDNSTGSPVFDVALKEALTADIDQSPFLNVLPGQKVREQLRFMGQPPDTPLKEDVARQICQRAGSKAMLMGSIAGLGSHYLIGLRAENCNTGDLLATIQAEAENREQVVKVLNKAASTMRGKLGESLASVQKYDTPVEQATTPSIDALQAYGMGRRMQDTVGDQAAIPFYKRAIELDPNFAMAYAHLSVAYDNLLQPSLSAANMTKAFELRDRTSPKEKLYISGHYYREVTGDLPKAIEAFTIFAHVYPREYGSHVNLGAIYSYIGKYEEGLAEFIESLRLNPSSGGSYAGCATLYCNLDRLEKMKATLHDAEARGLASDYLPQGSYLLGFLTNDPAEMKKQLASSLGTPGVQEPMLQLQSDTEAYLGRMGDARTYTKRAVDAARQSSNTEEAALFELIGSLHESEVGYQQQGLQAVRAVGATDGETQILHAMALARAGDGRHAQSIADALERQYPSNTSVLYYWLPAIRSAIELDGGNPAHAIELLQPAEQYELGTPSPFFGPMYPIYLRGIAYLKLGQGHEAAQEFEKILAHRGVGLNFVTSALSQLQLARALAMTGDRASARHAYETFLRTWKGADSAVPVFVQAKAEYAKLN